MDKQEFIEKLKKEQQSIKWDNRDAGYNAFYNGIDTAYSIAIGLAKKLDEPKKVVFSHEEKFVADWLDGLKREISGVKLNSGAVFMTFIGRQLERYYDEDYSLITDEVERWLTIPKNKARLFNAIDNGYEVEKEQLYYVKLPGVGYLNNAGGGIKHTEKEIKSIDERYWLYFTKKVEDE